MSLKKEVEALRKQAQKESKKDLGLDPQDLFYELTEKAKIRYFDLTESSYGEVEMLLRDLTPKSGREHNAQLYRDSRGVLWYRYRNHFILK